MNLSFEIIYHPHVLSKDLTRISSSDKNRIRKAIEQKLATLPHEFGEPLRFTLKGLWKLRVGDYRVIYKIENQSVLVLRIGHRREIYQEENRL